MTARIVRIGNALSVEIPEKLVIQAALRVGEPVEWVSNGSGRIALVKSPGKSDSMNRNRMTIEELMEGLEDGDSLDEFEWGRARGAEVW